MFCWLWGAGGGVKGKECLAAEGKSTLFPQYLYKLDITAELLEIIYYK